MSTYSPNLRIQLITTGDQVGTWGTTTNTNLGTLLEDAISGYTSVSVTTANQALTANNGSADQSRNVSLALTTTTTAAFAVYAPPAEKTYVIYNASSYTATIYNSTVLGNTTAAGAGVAIPAGKTVTVWSDGTDFRFQNNHLSSLTLATDLAVADGGTGASTAADARTNLGLGTIATQNSNSVSITGGSITGITDLAVADGGTGSSTAAGARTNLGVAIGSDVQAYNAGLADIAGLAKTDGNLIVGNGTNWVAESGATARTSLGLGTIATQNSNSVTITGGSISGITDLAVADGGTGASTAANARTNLGVAIGSDVQAYNAGLADIAGLAKTDGNLIVGNGTNWVAESGSTARTSLGLGTIATQNSNSVTITGGSISGITDLAVADGGTGASTAADARTNLGVAIGSDVQAYNAGLADIAGLAKTDGNLIVGNGTNWVAESGSTARTSLGLGTIATQNSNSVTITGGSITGITDLAVADGGTGASTAADARSNLGLVIGTNVPSPTGTGASGTWSISISGNANTATSSTSATTSTDCTNAVGYNQTWQAFDSSTRLTNTSFVWASLTTKYTNSTGKPIMVSVGRNGQNGYRTVVWVDAVAVLDAQVDQYGGSESMGTVLVPAGAQYAVSVSAGWCNYWVELR